MRTRLRSIPSITSATPETRPSVWQLLVAGIVDWALALALALFAVFGLHLGPVALVALALPFIVGALVTRSPGGLVGRIAVVGETTGKRLTPLRALVRVVVQLGLTLPAMFVTWAALMACAAIIGSLAGMFGAGWILDERHMAWFVLPALAVTFGIAAAGQLIGDRIGAGLAPWDRAAHSRVRNVRSV